MGNGCDWDKKRFTVFMPTQAGRSVFDKCCENCKHEKTKKCDNCRSFNRFANKHKK
jgi:3-oxoacyl-[acyl-carrier-protein] synthase III